MFYLKIYQSVAKLASTERKCYLSPPLIRLQKMRASIIVKFGKRAIIVAK